MLQDLQAEVEAQQGVYDSLASTGNQLLPTMGAPDAQKLQSRLEEMNRRWLLLMTKSMEIRSVPLCLMTKPMRSSLSHVTSRPNTAFHITKTLRLGLSHFTL